VLAYYGALASKDTSVSELLKHISLDWVLADAIEEITVSPYADLDYEEWVRRAVKAADPRLAARVVLSELHERRDSPSF
jgi:hypothetical protein